MDGSQSRSLRFQLPVIQYSRDLKTGISGENWKIETARHDNNTSLLGSKRKRKVSFLKIFSGGVATEFD